MDSHSCAKNAQGWGTRHEIPPNGVDIPVNRFAISENFMGGLFPLSQLNG